MTRPDAPLRMEFEVEVPGSPEQVWDAIATADGISSWFLRTELEEREGGAIVTYMGEDMSSPGTVTGWDPPRRLRYEEPDWAELTGHDPATTTPLVTEFLVEASSGGTCVVRVVSSAFGSGAEWEREFFEMMEKSWRPFFDRLRFYLDHFPGQRASLLSVERMFETAADEAWPVMLRALGNPETGQAFGFRDHEGTVEHMSEGMLLVRLTAPVPGFLSIAAYGLTDGRTTVAVGGQLFSEDAASYVEREQQAWKDWVDSLDFEESRAATS